MSNLGSRRHLPTYNTVTQPDNSPVSDNTKHLYDNTNTCLIIQTLVTIIRLCIILNYDNKYNNRERI